MHKGMNCWKGVRDDSSDSARRMTKAFHRKPRLRNKELGPIIKTSQDSLGSKNVSTGDEGNEFISSGQKNNRRVSFDETVRTYDFSNGRVREGRKLSMDCSGRNIISENQASDSLVNLGMPNENSRWGMANKMKVGYKFSL